MVSCLVTICQEYAQVRRWMVCAFGEYWAISWQKEHGIYNEKA